MLVDLTGGATAIPGTGFYLSLHNGLVEEDVTIVTTSLRLP
jgi:hypothetical protein